MKRLNLATALCAAMFAAPSLGAVIEMTAVTTTGTGDLTVTGFTAGANSASSGLIGATVPNATAGETRFWDSDGADPTSETAALQGLVVTQGTLNTSNGTIFQLGGIGLNDVLFLFEMGFRDSANDRADDVVLGVVDATGTAIGDYQISLVDLQNILVDPGTIERESGSDLTQPNLVGTTFTLADFTGTTGDLSQATGPVIVDNDPALGVDGNGTGPIDVTAVGKVIPEPASIALLGLGTLCLLGRSRRAS